MSWGRPRNNAASFWEKVDRRGPDECWPWLQSTKNGYGRFCQFYVEVYAHRHAYTVTYGPIPDDRVVMHACNNKACCNPSHLRLGTAAENTADAYCDGLAPSGERHHKAKLTASQVAEIRQDQRTQVELARVYGVCQATISSIKRNKIWKHGAAQ